MWGSGLQLEQALSPEAQQKKEEAWTAHVRSQPEYILGEERARQAEMDVRKQQAADLSMGLAGQKAFASKARGKNGTLLTDPLGFGLGVSGSSTTVPGQKRVLGL